MMTEKDGMTATFKPALQDELLGTESLLAFEEEHVGRAAASANQLSEVVRLLEAWHESPRATKIRSVILASAVAHGHADIVEAVLMRSSGDASLELHGYFMVAVRAGHVGVVDRMLRHNLSEYQDGVGAGAAAHVDEGVAAGRTAAVARVARVDSAANDLDALEALSEAACNGHVAVVERLLDDPRVSRCRDISSSVAGAARYGHLAVLRQLLERPTIPAGPGVDAQYEAKCRRNTALFAAAEGGHAHIVRWLLSGTLPKRIAIADTDYQHGHHAAAGSANGTPGAGPTSISATAPCAAQEMSALPASDSATSTAGGSTSCAAECPLATARLEPVDSGYSGAGSTTVTSQCELLVHQDAVCGPLTPADGELLCELVYAAAKHNRVTVTHALLQHVADLAGDQGSADACSAALCGFASAGRLDRMQELLCHPLVNPAVDDNAPVRLAAESGVYEVVAALLADPRVDPSARSNDALRKAVEGGCAPIVDLLLQHLGVDPLATMEVECGPLTRWHRSHHDHSSPGSDRDAASVDALSLSLLLDSQQGYTRCVELMPLDSARSMRLGPHAVGASGSGSASGSARAASMRTPRALDSEWLQVESDAEPQVRPGRYPDSESDDPRLMHRFDSKAGIRRKRTSELQSSSEADSPSVGEVPRAGRLDVTMRLLLQPQVLRSRLHPPGPGLGLGLDSGTASRGFKTLSDSVRQRLTAWPGSRVTELGWLAWRRRVPVVAARQAALVAASKSGCSQDAASGSAAVIAAAASANDSDSEGDADEPLPLPELEAGASIEVDSDHHDGMKTTAYSHVLKPATPPWSA